MILIFFVTLCCLLLSVQGGKNPLLSDSAVASSHLRKEISSEEWVKQSTGFYEAVLYSGGKSGGCVDPTMKALYAINSCAPSARQPGAFMLGWAYVDSAANVYYVYNQFFEDSACTSPITDAAMMFQRPILTCNQPEIGGYELSHIIKQPLSPQTDNLGITLLIYDNVKNCQANNYQNGVLEAFYARLNYCYQSSAGDYKYTACSGAGLTTSTYSTTNGSCGGKAKVAVLNGQNACSSNTMSVAGAYAGWQTWGCSTNHMN